MQNTDTNIEGEKDKKKIIKSKINIESYARYFVDDDVDVGLFNVVFVSFLFPTRFCPAHTKTTFKEANKFGCSRFLISDWRSRRLSK